MMRREQRVGQKQASAAKPRRSLKRGNAHAPEPSGMLFLASSGELFSPSHIVVIDAVSSRPEKAEEFGADITVLASGDPQATLANLGDGLGADVAIEAVGMPATFELCTQLIRPGGHIANIGVHGKPATLHLESLWSKNVTITTGLVDTYSTPQLLRMAASGQLDTAGLITHRFGLEEMLDGYDVFERAGDSGALKVALFRT
jgi:alcohol dehydrogenase